MSTKSREAREVLERREDPAARRAFRLAGNPHSQGRAYPYLAGLWSADEEWKLTPLLLFASLAGHLHQLRDGEVPPGVALRHGGRQAGQRVSAAYQLPLPQAHRLLLAALRAGDVRVVDWDGLWDLYRLWDHPDSAVSARTRRRLLSQFYATVRADQDVTTTDHDTESEARDE